MSSNPGREVPRPASSPDQSPVGVSRSKFAESYPQLYKFIAVSRKNDNFHERGCFTVFAEDGMFKIFLNDRPEGRSCAVSHQEVGGALSVAEAGLRAGTLRWRVNKQYRAKAKSVYA